ncbi:MAG: response regulator [Pseudomonadota bacterium]
MTKVLLVGRNPGGLSALAAALSETAEVDVRWAEGASPALDQARQWRPHLAVLDDGLDREGPWPLIRALLAVDAFLNTAVVSALESEEFHEAGEGLGILAQLPPAPGPAEAAWLLYHLRALG